MLLTAILSLGTAFVNLPTLTPETLHDKNAVLEVAREGVFYYPIPDEWRADIEKALLFCYRFPQDSELKNFSDGHFGGYHNRENYQVESFYVEKKEWNKVLPFSIVRLANHMDFLAKTILKNVLEFADFPKPFWHKGTGNVSNCGGQNHFSFNHYCSEVQATGMNAHRDFGYVSILFFDQNGPEVFYKNEWKEVAPKNGYFVIFLGRALETLVNDDQVVRGVWHRVPQVAKERGSVLFTCDNDRDSSVYQLNRKKESLEVIHSNYQEYLKECFAEVHVE
ncbi:MAG: 2OG-Fe(II) oxygenase family protein [Candidatus Algichlamydia australiensis]|nr:2OG-Fe(II) oxygenase family protein [Chlamydiales bacterium]